MARTTHTALTLLGPYPTLPLTALSADKAFVAADATEKEEVALNGKQIVIAYNSGISSRTITFTSVATGLHKRTGDITTYAIAAGVYSFFGPFDLEGWRQTNGKLYFEASHADVKFIVLTLP